MPFGKHKGYCMATLIELVCSGIAGVGFPLQPGYQWDQGTVIVAVDISAFQPLDKFRAKVAEFRWHNSRQLVAGKVQGQEAVEAAEFRGDAPR